MTSTNGCKVTAVGMKSVSKVIEATSDVELIGTDVLCTCSGVRDVVHNQGIDGCDGVLIKGCRGPGEIHGLLVFEMDFRTP